MRTPANLAASLPAPITFTVPIPDGDGGISRTVAWMQGMAMGKWGAKHWTVRQAALEAARGTERGMDEIDAVLRWVKEHIEFRGEHGETIQDPMNTLRWRAGDCDDQSMLIAAMLASLGFETRFRTVAMAYDPTNEYSHVYVEVFDRRSRRWIPLDATVARSWPGWEPEDIGRSRTYGEMHGANSGGGLLGLALGLGALLMG